MKKTKLHFTPSEEIKSAIKKDLEEAYDEACYETYDHHGTLDTLQELGVDAMPHTQAALQQLENKESNSYKRLLNIWGL